MSTTGFSCFLIGGDTLLLECATILLESEHDVRGIITSAAPVRQWCLEHDILAIDAAGDYETVLTEEPFDYLFAITHLAILPDRVLDLPRRLTVNFHDGPLPRYAGLNAPVWAIINRETEYGISWHIVTSGVDKGDLLKQEMFEIGPGETALSLNTKCMAAAVDSFPRLVAELSEGRETRTEQDASLRTYYAKCKRPPGACSIDWQSSAVDVDALVRALTFGPYANPVGSAKIWVDGSPHAPVVVTSLAVVEGVSSSSQAPGEIVEVTEKAVTIATADGFVAISGVASIAGADLALPDLDLSVGMKLGPAVGHVRSLTEVDSSTCRHEGFWAERLRRAEPPDVPQASTEGDGDPNWHRLEVEIPDELSFGGGEDAVATLLAAFSIYLTRTGRREDFHLGLTDGTMLAELEPVSEAYATVVPFEVHLDTAWTVRRAVQAMRDELELLRERQGFLCDLVQRDPGVAGVWNVDGQVPLPVGVAIRVAGEPPQRPPGSLLSLILDDGLRAQLVLDGNRISEADAVTIRDSLVVCMRGMASGVTQRWSELPLISEKAFQKQIVDWNATARTYDASRCVHQSFEDQVDRTPEATAVVFEGSSITYRALDDRANCLARFLQRYGVGPDQLVGVNVERSIDLLVATLGIMKAGGAYVPLDPRFPPERRTLMIADSGARVLITQAHLEADLPESSARVVRIDDDWAEIAAAGSERPTSSVSASNLAYVIYTSGSTGKPKGVLVEHRSVENFFVGMDDVIHHDDGAVWLAVTSLSFDISVLELFWTLARGFKVVVFSSSLRSGDEVNIAGSTDLERGMDFGLFMWGNDDGPGPNKYRLMLEGARFFDENGFDSVWTPERHFHAFGGPFPNPAVTGAAIAAVTERLSIRSGSCVSPLHHPVRVAEEWAVVDNLSDGRVGLAFAAGWQPNDFVLQPGNYPDQKNVMIEQIDVVRRLWRGESVSFENPLGQMVGIETLPRPVQPELPFWLTTAGNPDTYRIAGEMGANVLTHLLGQSLGEVSDKIAIYRRARAKAGFDPATGNVTLMLHAFVGEDDDEVREIVRQPMKDYLGASMKLVLGFAWTFPAFKRPGGPDSKPADLDLSTLSDEETDAILDFAFDRYFETSGLFGTPETCRQMVELCKGADVDEIACLLDFGVDTDLVMDSLPGLKVVRDAANVVRTGTGSPVQTDPTDSEAFSFATQVGRYGATHLQCTPSMARLLVADPESRDALRSIRQLLVGGEAFPAPLAEDLSDLCEGRITNMYGPTETTIWSSTHPLHPASDPIPIGRPIANTQLYILDLYGQPLPTGVPGELYIGGDGIARGYHERPDLTDERFVLDPFQDAHVRMYRTGDLAKYRSDGTVDFLGRVDQQVKIRGHRIELGEIEAVLDAHDGVRMSAVLLREDMPGDQRLIAYVVSASGEEDGDLLRSHLQAMLPEYMVPGNFTFLERMPLTPNRKIDRGSLPAPHAGSSARVFIEPEVGLERTVAGCWQEVLQLDRVGADESFFDVGGHSLLVVQLHRELVAAIDEPISLVDLYRFPTVRSLSAHLSEAQPMADMAPSAERAQRRKAGLARRRKLRS